MASSHVGGLSGAFIPVSEDEGMIAAAQKGTLFQFFKLCIGAGIRPPRRTKSTADSGWTGMMGAGR